jgi:hypothetical protein
MNLFNCLYFILSLKLFDKRHIISPSPRCTEQWLKKNRTELHFWFPMHMWLFITFQFEMDEIAFIIVFIFHNNVNGACHCRQNLIVISKQFAQMNCLICAAVGCCPYSVLTVMADMRSQLRSTKYLSARASWVLWLSRILNVVRPEYSDFPRYLMLSVLSTLTFPDT